MTVHIAADSGDIAGTVLMPGDPYRARWVAETFLESPVQINEIRGMLGYTGLWNGHRVTVHGSGMGMPSLSIYVNELMRDHGARTLIRIGSAGAMQPHIRLRDIVLAMTASSVSTPSSTIFGSLNFAPCADWNLLRAAVMSAERHGFPTHVGGIYSSDTFYDERDDLLERMVRHGILAVEMETAELYALASRHGGRALSVLTVSDHLQSREQLRYEDRERSFGDMVLVALEAAFS